MDTQMVFEKHGSNTEKYQDKGGDLYFGEFNGLNMVSRNYYRSSAIDIDSKGDVYILISDQNSNYKIKKSKVVNTKTIWEDISDNFKSAQPGFHLQLLIDSNDNVFIHSYDPTGIKLDKLNKTTKKLEAVTTLQVKYLDYSNIFKSNSGDLYMAVSSGSDFTAWKLDLNAWKQIGTTIAVANIAYFYACTVNSKGDFIVAYENVKTRKTVIQSFEGGKWVDKGVPKDSGSRYDLFSGKNDELYFVSYSVDVRINKFNAGAWDEIYKRDEQFGDIVLAQMCEEAGEEIFYLITSDQPYRGLTVIKCSSKYGGAISKRGFTEDKLISHSDFNLLRDSFSFVLDKKNNNKISIFYSSLRQAPVDNHYHYISTVVQSK